MKMMTLIGLLSLSLLASAQDTANSEPHIITNPTQIASFRGGEADFL
jgi:hypothetical protein